jgi:hypothetical protein
MNVRETEWGGLNCIGLAQDRDKWRAFCECGNEPPGSVKYFELSSGYTISGLQSSAQLHRVSFALIK